MKSKNQSTIKSTIVKFLLITALIFSGCKLEVGKPSGFDDPGLGHILVNGSFIPVQEDIYNYTYQLPYKYSGPIEIDAQTTISGAKHTITLPVDINSSDTEKRKATIVVTALDGETNATYKVLFNFAESGFMGNSIQGKDLDINGTTTLLAGKVNPAFSYMGMAFSMVADETFYYVSDYYSIRKINKTTLQAESLIPDTLNISSPPVVHLLFGRDLYYSVGYQIKKVNLDSKTITDVTTQKYSSYQDGSLETAAFGAINGMATDGTHIYVSGKDRIRKIDLAQRTVSTIAGTGSRYTYDENYNMVIPAHPDGNGTSAYLYSPSTLIYKNNALYILDYWGIRTLKLSENYPVTTISSIANFTYPRGMALYNDTFYVGDENNITKIDLATGAASTAVTLTVKSGQLFHGGGDLMLVVDEQRTKTNGTFALSVYSADENTTGEVLITPIVDGDAEDASFKRVTSLTTDGTYVYTTDQSSIRKINATTGETTTLAGIWDTYGSADGSADEARFKGPSSLTLLNDKLYVCDQYNFVIREIDLKTLQVKTVAGKAGEYGNTLGIGGDARFERLISITTDGKYLYVIDGLAIKVIDPSTWEVTYLPCSTSYFYNVVTLTCDGDYLYAAMAKSIIKISLATKEVSLLAGDSSSSTSSSFYEIKDMTSDGSALYVIDGSFIRKVDCGTGAVKNLTRYYHAEQAEPAVNRLFGITTDGKDLFIGSRHRLTSTLGVNISTIHRVE